MEKVEPRENIEREVKNWHLGIEKEAQKYKKDPIISLRFSLGGNLNSNWIN